MLAVRVLPVGLPGQDAKPSRFRARCARMLPDQSNVGLLRAWWLDSKAGVGTLRGSLVKGLDSAHKRADVVNLAFHKLVAGLQPRESASEHPRFVGRNPKRDGHAQTGQLGQLLGTSDRSGCAVPKHGDPVGEMLSLIEIVSSEQYRLA